MFSILFPVYNLVHDVMALWSEQTVADWHAMSVVEHTLGLMVWVRIVFVGMPSYQLFNFGAIGVAADDDIPFLF